MRYLRVLFHLKTSGNGICGWEGKLTGHKVGSADFLWCLKFCWGKTAVTQLALLLLTTSQGTDNFEIAQVFGVSCKLSDIGWAQMDSHKPLHTRQDALGVKCTPAHPVLHAHYVSKSGVSRDLRQCTNPKWQNLSDARFVRAGTVSVTEEPDSELSLGYSKSHFSEGQQILSCSKVIWCADWRALRGGLEDRSPRTVGDVGHRVPVIN